MKRLKVAQLGVGHDHASAVINTLKLQNDIYELVGYAIVPEDSGNLPRFSYEGQKGAYEGVPCLSVDELLNYPGLDAVFIETEDRVLTKYSIMAAEKGLHVQMDKPGGIEDDEFDRLIDIVKEKKLVFHTGYMYRYNPAVLQLKEDIKNGKLGEIYAVEAQMNCIHEPDKREWLGFYPGGMLYWLGCHLIDLVYSIMGEPEEIIPLSMPIGTDGITADDFGMAVFKYKNGVSFVKSTAVEYGGFERRQFVVCGTNGTVELKPFEWLCEPIPGVFSAQKTVVREAYKEKLGGNWGKEADLHESHRHGRYDAMYRAFASYVRGEKDNPFGYEYERKLHKVILRACGKEL